MYAMFHNCLKLNILNISNFDTSKVTLIETMFYNTPSLKEILISKKCVINEVTDVTSMFVSSDVSFVTLK